MISWLWDFLTPGRLMIMTGCRANYVNQCTSSSSPCRRAFLKIIQSQTVKGEICIQGKWPIWSADIPCFCSMKRLGVFLFHPDGMLVHHKVNPSFKFTDTPLCSWVERRTLRVKCLAQEHNTMSPA